MPRGAPLLSPLADTVMTATVEETGETVTHDVTQAYRVDGTLVEFVPTDDAPGYRYRVRVDGTNTREWVSDEHRRPSKSLAVFFYEKVENSRYVIT
jgi:hypothetical protein